jgi:hypothetical protein
MTTITETLNRPGGTAAAGAVVEVRLAGVDGDLVEGFVSGVTVVSARVVPTAGKWQLDLPANTTITPAGTAWRRIVTVQGRIVADDYLSVPAAGGPYRVDQVLTTAPASITNAALDVERAARIAADAAEAAARIAGAYGKSVDNPSDFIVANGPASAFDYEAQGVTAGLPAPWLWVNQGGATAVEALGALQVSGTSQVGDSQRIAVQSLAGAPASWLATFKLTGIIGNTATQKYGPCLRDSSTGKLTIFSTSHANTVELVRWTNETTPTTQWISGVTNYRPQTTPTYWRIRKNSATSFDFEFSMDGYSWRSIAAALDLSVFHAPDQIGFTANCNGGDAGVLPRTTMRWFRLR